MIRTSWPPSSKSPSPGRTGSSSSDPDVRRGPFADAAALHPWLESPFHRKGDVCGTCHDVSSPVFVAGATPGDYVPTPFNAPHPDGNLRNMFPIERTFSEWKNTNLRHDGACTRRSSPATSRAASCRPARTAT